MREIPNTAPPDVATLHRWLLEAIRLKPYKVISRIDVGTVSTRIAHGLPGRPLAEFWSVDGKVRVGRAAPSDDKFIYLIAAAATKVDLLLLAPDGSAVNGEVVDADDGGGGGGGSGNISGSGTAGQVARFTGAAAIGSDGDLTFDPSGNGLDLNVRVGGSGVDVNADTTGWPLFALRLNNTLYWLMGVARANNDIVAGSLAGDVVERTQTQNKLISLDGGTLIHGGWHHSTGDTETTLAVRVDAGGSEAVARVRVGPQVNAGMVKVFRTFQGRNGAGSISVPGLIAGDVVDAVQGLVHTLEGDGSSQFESTITVTNQIQQSSASDLTALSFLVVVDRRSGTATNERVLFVVK